MALSSLSFLVPHPPPDLLQSSVTGGASSACSRPCSLSTSHSLWMSSERSQFAVVAAKGKREMMDFEFLGDDDDAEEEDKVPDYIANMEEWMRNRPAGFGVDKVYDLALEEKLLAEIEADKKAQAAAKLAGKGSKGKIYPKKVTEAPAGVEVWVGNLPRKRKVERDLRAVFRNAPGLLHIRPIVEPENEKTRDPMCRGFAFFTFATEDDAYDFVSMYHGERVKFGKLDKKIACEVAKSDSPWHPNPSNRASTGISAPRLQVRETEFAEESRLPSPPTKKMDRELDIVTDIPLATSFTDKSSEEEEEEELDEEASETELRVMEEEIWDQFEDEDDIALDLELSQAESLHDEDEPSQIRSAVDEEESSELVESVRGTCTNVEETGCSRVSSMKARDSLHEEDVDEEEYSVEKIKALEAKIRDMERKLQLSAQSEEERVALLEKRVLSRAKSAIGVSTSKGEGEKTKAGAKKKSQAGKKSRKSKSEGPQKPKIGSLGSASRLRAKERAILTGVMSKKRQTAWLLESCRHFEAKLTLKGHTQPEGLGF